MLEDFKYSRETLYQPSGDSDPMLCYGYVIMSANILNELKFEVNYLIMVM